jgi:hypothetical protein
MTPPPPIARLASRETLVARNIFFALAEDSALSMPMGYKRKPSISILVMSQISPSSLARDVTE